MSGIHHVTAISGNAARNLHFYRHVIGLRFVKKTVNFDDPSTYHLYYYDEDAPHQRSAFGPGTRGAQCRSGVPHNHFARTIQARSVAVTHGAEQSIWP